MIGAHHFLFPFGFTRRQVFDRKRVVERPLRSAGIRRMVHDLVTYYHGGGASTIQVYGFDYVKMVNYELGQVPAELRRANQLLPVSSDCLQPESRRVAQVCAIHQYASGLLERNPVWR